MIVDLPLQERVFQSKRGDKMNVDVMVGFLLGFSAGLLTALIIVIKVFLPKIKPLKTRNDPNVVK